MLKIIRELNNDNGNKAIGLYYQPTTLHVHHVFWYIVAVVFLVLFLVRCSRRYTATT